MDKRAIILLKACHDLLNKQEESKYNLNLLMEDVFYNDEYHDGYTLSDDIADYLTEHGCLVRYPVKM